MNTLAPRGERAVTCREGPSIGVEVSPDDIRSLSREKKLLSLFFLRPFLLIKATLFLWFLFFFSRFLVSSSSTIFLSPWLRVFVPAFPSATAPPCARTSSVPLSTPELRDSTPSSRSLPISPGLRPRRSPRRSKPRMRPVCCVSSHHSENPSLPMIDQAAKAQLGGDEGMFLRLSSFCSTGIAEI